MPSKYHCVDEEGYSLDVEASCAEEAAEEFGQYLHDHAEFYEGFQLITVFLDGKAELHEVEIEAVPAFSAQRVMEVLVHEEALGPADFWLRRGYRWMASNRLGSSPKAWRQIVSAHSAARIVQELRDEVREELGLTARIVDETVTRIQLRVVRHER